MSDEAVQNHLPADVTAQRVYLEPKNPAYAPPPYSNPTYPTVAGAKAAFVGAVNSGALMVQYGGHGAVQYWGKSGAQIWNVNDVPSLTNGAKLPVIVSFNCMDGFFTYSASSVQSLAETMFRQAGGGSVAAVAPSGQGLTFHQQEFRKILMDTMFKDNVRELGRALVATKQKYAHDLRHELPRVPDESLRRSGPASAGARGLWRRSQPSRVPALMGVRSS